MSILNSNFRRHLPVALLLALPATADAHTVISGVGDYFSGVLHPLTTPEHVLVLLGLGLLLGQHSLLNLKTALTVFVPASALDQAGGGQGQALTTGALVALAKSPGIWVCRGLFALAALALGLDSAVESGIALVITKTLLGTWTGLILAVADVAYYASLFNQRQWQQVGLRVAGSWITAASFMILAFALRR